MVCQGTAWSTRCIYGVIVSVEAVLVGPFKRNIQIKIVIMYVSWDITSFKHKSLIKRHYKKVFCHKVSARIPVSVVWIYTEYNASDTFNRELLKLIHSLFGLRVTHFLPNEGRSGCTGESSKFTWICCTSNELLGLKSRSNMKQNWLLQYVKITLQWFFYLFVFKMVFLFFFLITQLEFLVVGYVFKKKIKREEFSTWLMNIF